MRDSQNIKALDSMAYLITDLKAVARNIFMLFVVLFLSVKPAKTGAVAFYFISKWIICHHDWQQQEQLNPAGQAAWGLHPHLNCISV